MNGWTFLASVFGCVGLNIKLWCFCVHTPGVIKHLSYPALSSALTAPMSDIL